MLIFKVALCRDHAGTSSRPSPTHIRPGHPITAKNAFTRRSVNCLCIFKFKVSLLSHSCSISEPMTTKREHEIHRLGLGKRKRPANGSKNLAQNHLFMPVNIDFLIPQ